jgi:hypothetical protein
VKILSASDANKLLNPEVSEEAEGGEGAEEEENSEEEAGGNEDGEKKKEMLPFDPAKLIPAEVIDLDNGTYEVKYKNETDEDLMVWVYYQNENDDFEQIRGSPFKAEFSKTAPPKNG